MTPPLKWEWIPGFPSYMISNTGLVKRSYVNAVKGFRTRELKPDIDKRGRRRYTLCRNGKARKFMASRLVLITFTGPCPSGLEACHENGVYGDDRLENLRWDTHSSNLLDRRRHGTSVQGEMINTSKLTTEEVKAIRKTGYPLRPLAIRFGVSKTMISLILRRKAWQHV